MATPELSEEQIELYNKLMRAVLDNDVDRLKDHVLKSTEELDERAAREGAQLQTDSTVPALLHHAHSFPIFPLSGYGRRTAITVLKAMKILNRNDRTVDMYLKSSHTFSTGDLVGAARFYSSRFRGSPMHVAVALRHKYCFRALLNAGGRGSRALDVCEGFQHLSPLQFIEGKGSEEDNTDEAEMYLEAENFWEKEAQNRH